MANAIKALFEFTVEGSHDFPFDMLRYDQCWPKRESEDSAKLGYWPRGARVSHRQVTLVGIKSPTLGRWSSFGWTVIPNSIIGRLL